MPGVLDAQGEQGEMMASLGPGAGWFGPMFDQSPAVAWAVPAFWIGAGVLVTVGFLWIRRSFSPGPLERGEASWRYRSRSLAERLDRFLSGPMLPYRTRGWWLTRIELGIATLMVLGLPPLWVLAQQPTVGGGAPYESWALALAGYAGMLVGLAWMVRIYRAGRRNDAEATWRYRDRQP